MSALQAIVDRAGPSLCLHGETTPADLTVAARAMSDAEPVDRRLLTLTHGLGFNLGTVSYALHLDPALAWWHLRTVLTEGAAAQGTTPAALESGLTRLLRDGLESGSSSAPAPPDGAPSWRAADLLATFPERDLSKLRARVVHDMDDTTLGEQRPGLGLGLLLLVFLAAAGFMVYGYLRDVDPLSRGAYLMRNGMFDQARRVFADEARINGSSEAEANLVLCWLAEGRFDEADVLLAEFDRRLAEDSEVVHPLGVFRPFLGNLTPVGAGPECRSLLPRGFITATRPAFVFRAGDDAEGPLVLRLRSEVGHELRTHLLDVSADKQGLFHVVPFPDQHRALVAGPYSWSRPDDENEAFFTVIDQSRARRIGNRANLGLAPSTVPEAARYFLRGHYYLRNELYQAAAEQFARLARRFPEQPSPRAMVERISQTLGVDRSVFLR